VSEQLQNGVNVLVENNLIAQISASSIGADGATVEEDYGWTKQEIWGFMGENALRVFEAN
jgi:hypothetical protein